MDPFPTAEETRTCAEAHLPGLIRGQLGVVKAGIDIQVDRRLTDVSFALLYPETVAFLRSRGYRVWRENTSFIVSWAETPPQHGFWYWFTGLFIDRT